MNILVITLLIATLVALLLFLQQQLQQQRVDAFSGSAAAAAAAQNPCTGMTTRQQTYQINACQLYTDRFQPLLTVAENDAERAQIQAKYDELSIKPTGTQYTQTYLDIVRRFLEFDRFALTFGETLPATYKFSAPVPIAVGDYMPGLITWETPAANPKSYKCVAFSSEEAAQLNAVRQFVGGVDARQTYLAGVKQGICRSKGYYGNSDTYAQQGCVSCDAGCCMPSNEALIPEEVAAAAAAAQTTCPKPTVRPFKIPPRQLRLRVVSPSVMQGVQECFMNPDAQRAVKEFTKSHKLAQLQQIPIIQ